MADSQLAAPELEAVEIHSMSRSSFIVRGALAASAVYGVSTVAPFVSQALAQGGGGDVAILNFALTLEYLEAAFYKKAQGLNLSGDAKKYAKEIGNDEQQHVDALTAAIKNAGATPVASPKFAFPITDQKSFLKLAQVLEDTGVGAYNGAGPAISDKATLAAAGSIVQIEGRHAAIIRLLNGVNPAPNAFDKSLQMPAVLKAVKPLIKA
ncbi:MAG TPA: ferritin-like domain-containing protein [Solirubrobacterales bacterium]